jgi:hypothetical protein
MIHETNKFSKYYECECVYVYMYGIIVCKYVLRSNAAGISIHHNEKIEVKEQKFC